MKYVLLKKVNSALNRLGLSLMYCRYKSSQGQKVKINIGSGDWSLKGWINLDYVTDWYKKSLSKHKVIHYNIREDLLPFKDSSVDLIYCSHVIEHIEDKFVSQMIDECFRVLNTNGVIRIACPDAEYLYNMAKTNSDYWHWREYWWKNFTANNNPRPVDHLVSLIATPKLLGYKYGINQADYLNEFEKLEMNDFFKYINSDLLYRVDCSGDHINWFTYEKLKLMLEKSGFKVVVRSKHLSSFSKEFLISYKFDTTEPNMSLYVEAIKI